MVWPYHRYRVWPCQVRQKYSCTVRSIGGLRHLPPQMKNHGLNEEKKLQEKITSIELSEVYVWLVWILTDKHKSLKRVETCQEKYFTLWLFSMLTRSSDLIIKWCLLSGYIYISVQFVSHWTLDCSFVFEWRCSYLGSERIPRLCLVDYTHTPYSLCLLRVCNHTLGLHRVSMGMIISSCLVPNCYPAS
jgi:hypothetical protein